MHQVGSVKYHRQFIELSLIACLNLLCLTAFAQSSDRNYVKTTRVKVPVTDYKKISALNDYEVQTGIQYLDGLGRPVQTIDLKISPSKTDQVLVQEYDELGREVKKYLPFISNQSSSLYVSNAVKSVFGFYAVGPDRVATTDFPYAEIRFDGSDLNIIKEQGAPGETWQLNKGHTVKTDQLTNSATEVRYWSAAYPKNGSSYAVSVGSYQKGVLYKTLITDENGSTFMEFKDKAGRLLLKRQVVTEPNFPQLSYDTYYIYDEKGNLVIVLPPKAESWFITHNTFDTRKLTEDLIFCYVYDERNRKVEEKIPGKEWLYYCYDDLDRQILMQDGNLRAKAEWIYTKYDQFSRVVLTGVLNDFMRTTRQDVQNYYRNYNFSNLMFINPVILTENFYDNYDFKKTRSSLDYVPDADFPDNKISDLVINKLTGTKTGILSQNKILMSAIYYDKYGRVIQTVSDNHLDGMDVVTNGYDFEGKLLKSKQTYFIQNGSSIVIFRRFEYDHAGRLKNTWLKLNNQAEILLSAVNYNALGQMYEKNLHSEDGGETFLQSVDYSYNIRGWLSHINLASLGDEYKSVQGGYYKTKIKYNDDSTDLFGMELFFDEGIAALNGQPLYNGNISGQKWQSTQNKGIRGYGYKYDRISRIKKAKYGELISNSWDKTTEKHSLTNINYDENGNILEMEQNGRTGTDPNDKATYGNMDKLSYTYSGNQLISVDDAVEESWYPNGDFNDYGKLSRKTGNQEYYYDRNGNMISDDNKGILKISYNHLNLPASIEFERGKLLYLYAASGTKLQQRTSSYDNCGDSMVKETDYIGSFVYENRQLSYILTEEGRLEPKADGSFAFEYFLKDHLGNTRVVFTTDNNSDGKPDVLQESSYYPYGLTFDNYNGQNTTTTNEKRNRYLFNGIELTDDLELNLYGMFYRQYDAQLGRWLGVDPKYSVGESVYLGMGGNPIWYKDPLGDLRDNYDLYEDGRINVERTKDNYNNYTFHKNDGKLEYLGTYFKNENGYIDMTKGKTTGVGLGWKKPQVNMKNYLDGDVAASFLSVAYRSHVKNNSTLEVTQFADENGAHSGNENYKGGAIDIRYISITGNGTSSTSSNFDKEMSQFVVDLFLNTGFEKAAGGYNVLTEDNNRKPVLTNTKYVNVEPHEHKSHFHLQHFNPKFVNPLNSEHE